MPERVGFQTKPQLAQRMLERAVESGVPFSWLTGDEVYGSDRNLRLWLGREGLSHVMAIKRSERLWALTEKGPLQVRADRLASQVEESGWVRCSAGNGAKGPRVYDWTAVDIRPSKELGKGYWLLARRSIAKPEELAYYVCFGPTGTTLEELAKVAGTRWAIEECFEEAKGQVGLDQYEVRRWDGWYRHITLSMLAQAYLAAIRFQAMQLGERGPLRSGRRADPPWIHPLNPAEEKRNILDGRWKGLFRGHPVDEARHQGIELPGQVGHRRLVLPQRADHVAPAVQVHDHPVFGDAGGGNPLGGDASQGNRILVLRPPSFPRRRESTAGNRQRRPRSLRIEVLGFRLKAGMTNV